MDKVTIPTLGQLMEAPALDEHQVPAFKPKICGVAPDMSDAKPLKDFLQYAPSNNLCGYGMFEFVNIIYSSFITASSMNYINCPDRPDMHALTSGQFYAEELDFYGGVVAKYTTGGVLYSFQVECPGKYKRTFVNKIHYDGSIKRVAVF